MFEKSTSIPAYFSISLCDTFSGYRNYSYGKEYHHSFSFDFIISSTDFWNEEHSDCENNSFHLSCCFVLKLNDLQSVNVGLFDQYFRITGEYILCFNFFQINIICLVLLQMDSSLD